jgi:tripartite ATP-independent transporter DctM subunit
MTLEPEHLLAVGMFATFILLLPSGFPVAWVLAGVGIAFTGIAQLTDQLGWTLTGLDYHTLGLLPGRIFGIMSNWVLVALPMFIFMGLMLDRSGVARRLLDSLQRLFGRLPGGLGIAVTLIGIILAASTGIIGASVVLLGVMSLPALLAQGYHRPLALGTVAASGCLGILIPPSIMLVIMGDQLGISVGDLFLAAVLPGLLLGALYLTFLVGYARLRPEHAPLTATAGPLTLADLGRVLRDILPPAGLILAVLGSVFTGLATVTEASGIGAFGATLLAAWHRRLGDGALRDVVIATMNTTGYIFAIFVGATVFALVLRECGGDQLIAGLLHGLGLSPMALVATVLALVFLLGFFLDWIEISLILLPLLAPVIAGLDLPVDGYGTLDQPRLVWFALLVAVALQTSFLTPPVGFAIFYLKGVSPPGVRLGEFYRGVVPFVLLQLLGLALVFAFPALATWLPALAGGR